MAWVEEQASTVRNAMRVPGATFDECKRLAVLGGAAASIIDTVPESWPVNVVRWLSAVPGPPTPLAADIRNEVVSGNDLFGVAYEHLVSARSRRQLGTFFTPD